jgi:predicted transcriptional regulator
VIKKPMYALGRIAADLLSSVDHERYAYAVSRRTGVPNDLIWAQLRAWVQEGWLETDYEVAHRVPGTKSRKYYLITLRGKQELTQLAENAQDTIVSKGQPDWKPKPLT